RLFVGGGDRNEARDRPIAIEHGDGLPTLTRARCLDRLFFRSAILTCFTWLCWPHRFRGTSGEARRWLTLRSSRSGSRAPVVDGDRARLVADADDAHAHGPRRQQRLQPLGPLDDRDAVAVHHLVQTEVEQLGQALRAVG